MTRPTTVIVGASLAGGRAAETLRAEGYEGRILLVGDEPHRPYERPPLSKEVLRGDEPPDKAFLRPEDYYAENDIELLLGARATAIDPGARTVALAEGITIGYDALLLCTGGRPRRLPIPGMDLDGVFTLRTIEDSLAIGRALQPGARVVVLGAGFIGAEVAAGARAKGADVVLVDIEDVVLARVLGPEVGRIMSELHAANGVRLRMGVAGERIVGDGRARRVEFADGTGEDADAVVVGVGMAPSDELAREAGIACDDGVLVDELCRTDAPGVYAAGDVARHPNPILGQRIRVEHWQNAQNQAAAAARAIAGKPEPFAEVPWFWSDQFDVTVQMFGHPVRWDRVVLRGAVKERSFAAFYLDGERLVAALGFNRPRDARAGRDLIKAGIAVPDEVLADADSDLRALARR